MPTAGPQAWVWNESRELPTLTPSLLRHPHGRHEMPDTPLCHLFIRDGQIKFLADCTHELAGRTVAMIPVADWPPHRSTI